MNFSGFGFLNMFIACPLESGKSYTSAELL